jgi:hypothetical protein
MAALCGHRDTQRENERDDRDAQVGRQAGDDGAVPSQAEIQCECAFTYMNAVFRKNLTEALAVGANGVRHWRRTRRWHGQSAVLPDDRDMLLLRERPPKTGRGTVIGGWQRGSLTPQMPPSLLLTAEPTATRAANSAARLRVVKLLIAKNIATSPADENHVPLAAR